MAKTITLHGGPWHGRTTAIEDGRDHIHIVEPINDAVKRVLEEAEGDQEFITVPMREGTYSRVAGRPDDFEWDGWRSHD